MTPEVSVFWQGAIRECVYCPKLAYPISRTESGGWTTQCMAGHIGVVQA